MRININVKPSVINTKESLLHLVNVPSKVDKVAQYVGKANFNISNVSKGAYANDKYVYGINVEKRKIKRKRIKKGKDKGKYKVIQPTHYIVYYYAFDKKLLETIGKKIKQNRKNFEIV